MRAERGYKGGNIAEDVFPRVGVAGVPEEAFPLRPEGRGFTTPDHTGHCPSTRNLLKPSRWKAFGWTSSGRYQELAICVLLVQRMSGAQRLLASAIHSLVLSSVPKGHLAHSPPSQGFEGPGHSCSLPLGRASAVTLGRV